ncbi:hypothetical protein GS415_04865 [Rhodococcus hoagii]|nr:hypothetical protein [Prescottella equi]
MTDSPTPIAYSLKQAAQVVPFGEEYLAREIRDGNLGAVKIGRRVTIPHKNLVAWYESKALEADAKRDVSGE